MLNFTLPVTRLVLLALPALVLTACESSQRLGSLLPGGGVSPRATAPAAPPPLVAAPGSDADTEELPPPPGSGGQVAALPPPAVPANPTPGLPQTAPPPGPSGVATAPGNLPPPRTAPAVPNPAPAAPAAAPSRASVTGNWALTEGAGNRCRITLSSAPKLDLYGAGTSGCSARELQRVNAWELAGSEVILYEPGGGVVARLRQSGDGFNGVSTRTGAPLSMSK